MMDIQNIIFVWIIIIISLSLHEYAHARMADRLGDPTPRIQWRLTPNPLAHIDPIWFIMIFIINFWWGKPVMTNPSYFRNPIKWDFLVAMAGPLSNIILAILWGIIIMVFGKIIWVESAYELISSSDLVVQFWMMFVVINIWLAVFNLLPIFPLDWYRIIKIASPSLWYWMERNGQILQIVFLVLIIWPWSSMISTIISTVSQTILSILFIFLSQIFY